MLTAETRHQRRADFRLWYLVAGALVGGAIFERLGTWLRHISPGANAGPAEQWLYGSRSILSGLVGAYAGVLVAKRLCRYESRTGAAEAAACAGCSPNASNASRSSRSWTSPRRSRNASPSAVSM